jgi:hypothetical protein
MAKAPKKSSQKVTWAHAFRDIVLKAMDRGQLFPLFFFIGALALIFKMPEEHVYDAFLSVLSGFKDFSLIGWLGMGLVSILWAGHARAMRRSHSSEYKRIGIEKSRLQQQQVNNGLGSSETR